MRFALYILLTISIGLDDPKTHLVKGKKYLESKEYIEAINEFTNAVSVNPNFAEAYYFRAKAKDILSKEGGFIIHDICLDLILAVENGFISALPMLKDKSDQYCHNLKAAVASPDAVYCADFSSSVLNQLPPNFGEMMFLINFSLFNNRFETMPNLTSSKYIVHLDVGSNQISSLPENFFKLEWLMYLNLTRNKIQTLPSSISNFKYLNELVLKENLIEQLPSTLSELKSLENLDLSFNRIKVIPDFFENMTNLKTLILTGNPISESQVNDLKRKLKSTRIYF